MNLYVDSKSLIKHRKKIIEMVEKQAFLTMTVNLSSFLTKYYLFNMIKSKFGIRPHLRMNISLLDSSDIKLYCNDRLDMELVVNGKLTKNQMKKLSKFTRTIKLYDYSNCIENLDFYKLSSNLVYCTHSCSNLQEAVAFDMSYFNYSDYTCAYSSCLGKTICIDKTGELYFCPYHRDKSHLCNLCEVNSFEEALNHDSFLQTIKRSINRRNACNTKNCSIYEKCYGGCPLDNTDCESIESKIHQASEKRKEIFVKGINLHTLKTYERESVQREISGYPLTKN